MHPLSLGTRLYRPHGHEVAQALMKFKLRIISIQKWIVWLSAANNANGEGGLMASTMARKSTMVKYKVSLGEFPGPKRTQIPLDLDNALSLSSLPTPSLRSTAPLLSLLVAHRFQEFNFLTPRNISNQTHNSTHKWILSPHLNSSTSRL